MAGGASVCRLAGLRATGCHLLTALARACARTRRVGLAIYLISIGVIAVGALFAFVLPLVLG